MNLEAETYVCKILKKVLSNIKLGEFIPESDSFQDALSGFERIVPSFLCEKYKFWKFESLDGIFISNAIKTGENEGIILGLCLLITDQTLTPIYLHFKIADQFDKFETFICKVGEIKNGELIRIPYSSNKWNKELYSLDVNLINWFFER